MITVRIIIHIGLSIFFINSLIREGLLFTLLLKVVSLRKNICVTGIRDIINVKYTSDKLKDKSSKTIKKQVKCIIPTTTATIVYDFLLNLLVFSFLYMKYKAIPEIIAAIIIGIKLKSNSTWLPSDTRKQV